FDLRPVMQVARRARQAGCEIIHTHSTRTLLVGRPAATIARLPIVHHVQSPAIADSTEAWRNRANAVVTRACLSGMSNIVAVSESLKDYLSRQGVSPQRVEVIPNAVPVRPVLPHRSTPTDPWTIGICAMFRPRKGMEVLLEGLSQLRTQGTRFTLRAVGYFQDAQYEAHIKHRVGELGLEDVVDWRGFSDNVYDELAQMDVFVLPSLFGEGMPLAVLEAMAAGVPVVSTDVEGTPEAVRDGVDGLIVEPGNAHALAAALQRIIRGDVDWQSLRTSAHRRQTELYSDTKLASDVARVYDRILGRGGAELSADGDESTGPQRTDEGRLELADSNGPWSCE
ncbi:MAG: glycosyltransferase, partial [Planctomycetota bacterium]|nr:glycosyltransferase [Planctomycetota bacterium]